MIAREIPYQEIYEKLANQTGYITTKQLAESLGTKARHIRAHGDVAGVLEKASDWIFEKYGKVIVRRMSPGGVKLSNSIEEIEASKQQWNSFHWNVKKIVDDYEKKIMLIRKRNQTPAQLPMEFAHQ